jgi:5'-deoxynucleotidase YfbR-like HD superfamily hydrolase
LICEGAVENLILEFDNRSSLEARFAYQCDKLECDIQCKLYDEQGCVDLESQKENAVARNPEVKKLIDIDKSWSDMWLMFGQRRYNYDKNFKSVSDYAMANKITKKGN